MKCFKPNKKILAHSVLWAAVMLLTAFFIKGQDYSTTVLIFMIGGWYFSHHLLTKSMGKGYSCASKGCNTEKTLTQGDA